MASLVPFNCFICLSLGGWDTKAGRKLKEISVNDLKQGSRDGCPTCSMLAFAAEELQRDATFVRVYFDDNLNGPLDVLIWSEASEESSAFEFHTIPGQASMWPAIGPAGRVSADSSSPTAMALASGWLAHCLKAHIACQNTKANASRSPTRVLDVGREKWDVFLYETVTNVPCCYAALTYCWGTGGSESGPMRTLKSNYGQRKNRISYDTMPRTLQQAIRITRELSIKFLWIDALCIIQDSPEDWDQESSAMSSIFANSTVTIAADGAAHCHEGCFVAGQHRNTTVLRIPCPGPSKKDASGKIIGWEEDSFIYVRKPGVRNESNGSHAAQTLTRPVIDTRAWTMQERLLAPRTLHYTASELVWECAVDTRCECQVAVKDATILNYSPFKQKFMSQLSEGDDERAPINRAQSRRLLDSKRFSWQPGYQSVFNPRRQAVYGPVLTSTNPRPQLRWRSVVVEYTQRNLTYNTDRLAAISGLASAMSEHDTTCYHASDYLFGIWKAELVRNLLWHVAGGELDIFNDVNLKTSERFDHLYAPSWSWASVTGAITYYDEITDEQQRATQLEPRLNLLDAACTLSTQNVYGPGTGELYVEGDLIPVILRTFAQGDRSVSRIFDPTSGASALGDASLDIQGRTDGELVDGEQLAWLIVAHLVALGRSNIYAQGIRPVGLLLKPVPGRLDTYRRVGLVKGYLRTVEWSKVYSSHQKKDNRRSLGGMMTSMGQRFRRALETNPDQFKSDRVKLDQSGKSLPVFESLPPMGVRIWII